MSTLCLYHKNCTDGLAAALAVRKHLWDTSRMKGSRFTTAQYGDTPPDVTSLDVIVVDFSYPRETLLEMKTKAKSLIVIDHHQTAQDALAGLDFCIFDLGKSGAVLAWEHFHPGKPLPKLMEYVQDRDLWQWKLPFSQEVSAALRSYKPFLNEWERFLDDYSLAGLIAEGAAILRYQKQQIEMALAQGAEMIELGGYTVPCINSTHLISEIGNELTKGHPFAALYFDTSDGKRVFSLRSTDEGIDVAEIAKLYGGGGHRNAAGFTVAKPTLLLEPILRAFLARQQGDSR